MELEQLSVRVIGGAAAQDALEAAIPVLHGWIRERAGEELLIDVADYRHVPSGPDLMIIGDAGHYGVDVTDGTIAVSFAARRDGHGPVGDKLRAGLSSALRLAARLERAGLGDFSARGVEVRALSRRAVPGGAGRALADGIEAPFAAIFTGSAGVLEPVDDPRGPATVRATLTAPITVAELNARLA